MRFSYEYGRKSRNIDADEDYDLANKREGVYEAEWDECLERKCSANLEESSKPEEPGTEELDSAVSSAPQKMNLVT